VLLESYSEPGSGLFRFEGRAMGTENVLLLQGDDEGALRRAAQDAFETLDRLEQSLSKFLPQSDVSLLNAFGAERPVRVSAEVIELLALSRDAWEASGGAFDPTIGELVHAWGLVDMEGRIPTEGEILSLLARKGMNRVGFDVDRSVAWFTSPGMSVDLGAIGKGYAVDAVSSRLQARGVTAGVFISGRSSIAAWGSAPGAQTWKIEVVHPEDPDESLAELEVEPGSISTSGAYVRKFRKGWKEYGHLLDPRTGRPAEGVAAVTVWTESALLGDVLSTAIFILGVSALEAGGCVERLARAWSPSGEPRASILLARPCPGRWGGLELETFHIGRPAFTLSR
jgi:thiamine biosynthesis lipoprotein